jgi:SET domain-containing protein
MAEVTQSIGFVKDTGSRKGRGVFAEQKISAGEIVEVCPVVPFQARWADMPEEVQRVVFDWGRLTKQKPRHCLALGWGSMYNHANPANVRYKAVADSLCMEFRAARDIDVGEELTVNYNETEGDVHSTIDVWFENTGVTPIE